MGRVTRLGLIALSLAGCGGAAARPDGSPTGAGGGLAGAGASGAAGGGGGGGTAGAGGLPACAVITRPNDPTNDAGGGVCNVFDVTGAWCNAEPFTAVGDAGVLLDGGATEDPAGGTVLDGDYDLARWRTGGGNPTRRTIRVFGSGTYIEWAVDQDGLAPDGGLEELRLDTTVRRTGNSLTVVSVDCGSLLAPGYGFSVSGDDLVLFNVNETTGLANVYTYRRTCAR